MLIDCFFNHFGSKAVLMDDKQRSPSITSLLMSFFPMLLSLLILSPMFPVTILKRTRLLPFDEIYTGFNLLHFFLSSKIQSLLIFLEIACMGSCDIFMLLVIGGASQ